MTPEQRLNAANEINGLWVRHVRHGEIPPDLNKVSRILERYELDEGAATLSNFKRRLGLYNRKPRLPRSEYLCTVASILHGDTLRPASIFISKEFPKG
jgi:hypothetical protein